MVFEKFEHGKQNSSVVRSRVGKAWVAGIGLLGFAVLIPTVASAAELQVSFIGGGAKGAWTRALTAMSECLRQNSDINATVTPTQGGMDAFGKLQADKGDFGFTYQSVLFPAWDGSGLVKGEKYQNLRVVGVAERLAVAHWVVSKKSGIKTLADIKGKKFAPGPIGTVTRGIVTSFLEAAGIDGQFDVANVSSSEMNSYLKDGKLDGWAWIGGVPTPAATEIAVSGGARFLDIGKELDSTGFLKKNPFFVKVTIPAGSYPGIDYPTTSFGQNGVFVAQKTVSDDVVYEVAKVLWSTKCVDYLSNNLKSLVAMKDSPLDGIAFPLHPGAIKLWNEKGLDTSDIRTPDKM